MSADRVIAACYWYLEHLHLFLIPGAVFDAVCWAVIILWWRRSGRQWWARRQMNVQLSHSAPPPAAREEG